MVRATVTFISGGARSGKSAYAENLLVSKRGRLVYIASGVAFDAEMQERIAKHRQDRKDAQWLTIEQPTNLHLALPQLQEGDLILWDCMTTWLANEMYEGIEDGNPCWRRSGCLAQKQKQLMNTLLEISEIAAQLVIVSNEVLDEWLHYEEETEVYRRAIGVQHQQLVQFSHNAIEMDHGLPLVWKGEAPI